MANAAIPPAPNSSSVILLPPHVAADISGLSTKTLARRGAAGRLTVEKRGTHRRYREDEIRALATGGAA